MSLDDLNWDMLSVVIGTLIIGSLGAWVFISSVEGYTNEVTNIKKMSCEQLFDYLAEHIDGGYYFGKSNEIAQKSFDLKCKSYNPEDHLSLE